MTEQTIIDLGSQTVWVAIQIAAPALLATLIMGVLISIVQAATQINEQTLSFIPKILALVGAMVLAGPWILQVMVTFTSNLLREIPRLTN